MHSPDNTDIGIKIASVIGLLLVFLGMINNIPSIPGLEHTIASIFNLEAVLIRKFPYEWLHPIAFVMMMLVTVLKHSFFRDAQSVTGKRVGILFDITMLFVTSLMAITYLIEIDSVCLIDQITGERAKLIAESLKEEIAFAELYGLPAPSGVDDPQCMATTGVWLFAIMAATIAIFLIYNIKVWGFPLVMVTIIVVTYSFFTIAVWYFYGAEDINKYLVTKLGSDPRQLIDGRPKVHDIIVNNSSGLLGRFMDILLNTVFPFIILGSLFGASAGGKSLIKLAFRWTRKLNGGPAHAAIVSSALFGTISGGPVVNVLATGVLTIPMMVKRGFSKIFAGGVEAAASSGGQIMPPIMGVAAFILAALTQVPYREVIIAAIIPAVAYFGCLFLSAVFQARKQNIKAIGKITEDMELDRQDKFNLIMIVAPLLLILGLLLTPKEQVGCGFIGSLFGVEKLPGATSCTADQLPWFFKVIQNSAGDAGSSGWWACILLLLLLFLDPKIRSQPSKILHALANAGVMISTLYLMFLSVSVIDFCLNLTGFSTYIARDILAVLTSMDLSVTGSPFLLFIALLLTMLMAVLLGMGMPSVPAYINVALLMGPMLAGLGIATFTAHMFIFYFAVASAITPPVAIAAFAAASITKEEPMTTGFSAVRSGIVIFVIPFVFAFHPELLLIDAAVLSPDDSKGKYLTGYDGNINIINLVWLLVRLTLSLYLVASSLCRFDHRALHVWEVIVRLILALLILSGSIFIYGPAILLAIIIIATHLLMTKKIKLQIQ
ncbi:MAG: TRAP transporter fused permease subunit [Paracoccaceae bacterium]|jgi:TRAP transporter 4TM/12TM fusion protein|nr:C4-dicarboxylate ABC transporter [Paracoccaceae bacterium]MDG1879385.1 TRAP transporter fused permease subunit [Paracoccaceae bacterium]|tara:strand:+ start:7706 stop:10033 length:2328 start_codon:yes stop_codon:yes gene_type:complete